MNFLKRAVFLTSFLPFFLFAQKRSISSSSNFCPPNLSKDSSEVYSNNTTNGDFAKSSRNFADADGSLNSVIEHKTNASDYIEKRYVRFFAGAGISLNTVGISGSIPIYNLSPRSYSSVGPKIFAGVNFYPLPSVGKSVIRLEFSYMTATYKGSGDLYYIAPVVKGNYQPDQHNFSIVPQFQYNIYNADLLKFYLDLGFSINISSYTGNQVYNSYTMQTQTDYFGTKKLWFSAPIKAGVILQRNFEISLGYVYPETISSKTSGAYRFYDYSIKVHSLQLGVNYLF